jgi:hypothetical protein
MLANVSRGGSSVFLGFQFVGQLLGLYDSDIVTLG